MYTLFPPIKSYITLTNANKNAFFFSFFCCCCKNAHNKNTITIQNKNRSGKKLRRFSHIRLVLREIDFPTKLVEATSINQKRKWLERLAIAREDYEKARVEKEELAELERLAAEVAEKKKKQREEKGVEK